MRIGWLALGLALLVPASPAQKTPEEFFGFPMGTDGRLARHPQIVEYLKHLDASSEWMALETLGDSTLGNPMVMAVFTSPENFQRLERIKQVATLLADPRMLAPGEVEGHVKEGKSIALITCNIHSTEVASAQMACELAWRIVADRCPFDRARVLGETVFLLIPSTNPDGQILVAEWYDRWKGGEWEAGPMPWLYHVYAGHDNNRDWFMLNLKETRLVSDVYYRSWMPQLVLDEHQMGSTGARLFVPPFAEPANPNVHPLIWRGLALLGSNMAMRVEQRGRTGVVDRAYYTAWWEGASIMTPWWHNIVGALSEMASCRIASPVYVEPNELTAARGFDAHEASLSYPNPWKGGWWRLRDIVDYELDLSFAFVETAARHREDFLRNRARMALDAVERKGAPRSFVIPAEQHDPVAASEMVEILRLGGVEVFAAATPFTADGKSYGAGSFVVPLAQPNGLYAKDLLEIQRYPDLREYRGGPPVRPYDMAGWTLGLQMGVETVPVDRIAGASLTLLDKTPFPASSVAGAGPTWSVGPETNASFLLANRVLAAGAEVYRVPAQARESAPVPGTWLLRAPAGTEPAAFRQTLAQALEEAHLGAATLAYRGEGLRLRRPRVGLYKPWVASMDEGWTRLLLERFGTDLKNLENPAIKAGNLRESFDAIVLPDMDTDSIVSGDTVVDGKKRPSRYPPEYQGGIGDEGVTALKTFVEAGGTLVCLDSACEFAIAKLDLPVKNDLKDVKEGDFFCPGSCLALEVDPSQPLAFGMPRTASAFFVSSSAFTTSLPSGRFDRRVAATYPARDILQSGWILGEDRLARRAAVVEVRMGPGRVALLGFRAQHRAQTPGTYKFLLNALFAAAAEPAELR
jgi:zinc carboxypeptidase